LGLRVEMGPLSSPVVSFYRLLISTIDLSLTAFAVIRLVTDGQTDRQKERRTEGICLAKAALCTKVHRPTKRIG